MSKSTFVTDEETEKELEELAKMENKSKSEIVRKAIKNEYLKEKRARENLDFFIDLYNQGTITKDLLVLLLPEEEAEAVIIGSKTGREAAQIAREISA